MANPNKHQSLPRTFVVWYYLEAPLAIVRGALAYAAAIAEIVPFLFLVRTLLSPWKNIVDRTVMHGIDLNRIAEKLALSFLARLVGLVIRLITIALGLIFEALLFAISIVYLAVWLAFPVLIVMILVTSLSAL